MMKLNKYKTAAIFILSFSVYFFILPYLFESPISYFAHRIVLWIISLPESIRFVAFVVPFGKLPTFLVPCFSWGIVCGIICFLLKVRYSGYYALAILLPFYIGIKIYFGYHFWKAWYSIVSETIGLCIIIFSAYISEVMCNFTIRVISRVSKLIKRSDDVNK